ncbi:MAG: ABC transporter permease [Clostridia bacterium]|nr:ABC transporter permease [Clostridia bacterium]
MLSVKDTMSKKLESNVSDDLFKRATLDNAAAERAGYSNYSYWGSTIRVFCKNKVAMAMTIVLAVLLVFTIIQPYLPMQRDPNQVNNHPATGIQMSNQAPSFNATLMTVPAGTELTVKEFDDVWYEATNIVGYINRRTDFTCVEYGDTWCYISYPDDEIEGYVETEWLKLPDEIPEGEFTVKSNYKISVYASANDLTNNGDPIYVKKSDVEIVDAEASLAATIGETDACILPEDSGYWFGTNNIGQDLWARVWAGTRTSLLIGVLVALVEACVGITVGVIWGYVRKMDKIMTEIYNILDNIPSTIVLILISYILKPGLSTLVFAMCLTGWLGMARFIRNQIVIIRDRDYNLASRCLGTGTFRIIMKNLLPYLVSVITLRMALAIPGAIGSEVFITYIGLGLPTDIPSLGNLINEGRKLITSPTLRYQLIFPAIVLSMITIAFYIIGNAFADAADPKNHL